MDLTGRLRAALSGRYDVEQELGRGGMAFVFAAQDLKHDRHVAIKVLKPGIAESLGAERFLREIGIEAKLQHPHILPLYDSGTADGLLFYVMPLVEGESLRDRLGREQQLSVEDAIGVATEVADALSYAHSRDVIHRDIKPENILLSGGHAVVADFGIARAVSRAGGAGLTDSGVAIGTPPYMSPEQASGTARLDGRSDMYALGCVLYEMLVGEPPFTGPTPQAVLARHMQETPPSLRIVRPGVSPALQSVVEKSLAKVPADRYATMSVFRDALERAERQPDAPAPGNRRVAAASAVTAVIVIALVAGFQFLRPTNLDALGFVVAPFEETGPESPLDGPQVQWRLTEALRAWDTVRVADPFQLVDAQRRRGDDPPTHDEWLAITRALGMGRLVRGESRRVGDTVYLNATLFDASRRGRPIQQATLATVPGQDDLRDVFSVLAARLLGLEAPGSALGARGTNSLPAGRAFVEGELSVAQGDLREAERQFREATQHDPNFADAHFWLAQTRAWVGQDVPAWAHEAQLAYDLRSRLADRRAAQHVEPLLDLARAQYSSACERYARLLSRDPTDFTAWFGAGECRFRDDLVMRDTASPSGWRFRSSYHSAATAYRRGLAIAPSLTSAFFFRLRRFLFLEHDRLRSGRLDPPDTTSFWAYPALLADTLAFVPYAASEHRFGRIDVPATHDTALAANRAVLFEIAAAWANAYPYSSDAQAAVAYNLEDLGRGEAGVFALRDALRHVRRARALARERGENVRIPLAQAEVRLLVKLGEFTAARDTGRQLLVAFPEPPVTMALRLAGVATLLGQGHAAAAYLALRAPDLRRIRGRAVFGDVPAVALQSRERLRAYAALGGPVDSLRRLIAQVDSLIDVWGRDPDHSLRGALLAEPLGFAFPEIGAVPLHRAGRGFLQEMQWLLADGEHDALRQRLVSLDSLRADIRPQDVAIGVTYQEVRLWMALGDTAAAVRRLDATLGNLAAFPTTIVSDAPNAGALVRAMALRAELALARGEPTVAARWAGSVSELWRQADPEFRGYASSLQGRIDRD